MKQKLFVVETISQFRMRYVVNCKSEEHALDTVAMGEVDQEFSQHHLGEVITSAREISDKEYLKLFTEDNAYASKWTDEQKFHFVHQVDYPEDEVFVNTNETWEFS